MNDPVLGKYVDTAHTSHVNCVDLYKSNKHLKDIFFVIKIMRNELRCISVYLNNELPENQKYQLRNLLLESYSDCFAQSLMDLSSIEYIGDVPIPTISKDPIRITYNCWKKVGTKVKFPSMYHSSASAR